MIGVLGLILFGALAVAFTTASIVNVASGKPLQPNWSSESSGRPVPQPITIEGARRDWSDEAGPMQGTGGKPPQKEEGKPPQKEDTGGKPPPSADVPGSMPVVELRLDKYRKGYSDIEIIGVLSPRAGFVGVANGVKYDLTAYKLNGVAGIDYSQNNQAVFKLKNTQAFDVTFQQGAIIGRPIIRLSNNKGMLIEQYIDYNDYIQNGEKTFRIGNNAITNKTQLEAIADYWIKYYRTKKHAYVVKLTGTCHYYQIGDKWTLQVGATGYNEWIDSIVEVTSIQISKASISIGSTTLVLQELEENWTKTLSVTAKLLASGDITRKTSRGTVYTVGASTYYKGDANIYCDGM